MDISQTSGKRTLAPIFAKKKQKTSLFAHPNNQSSQNANYSSGLSGSMPQSTYQQHPRAPPAHHGYPYNQTSPVNMQMQHRNEPVHHTNTQRFPPSGPNHIPPQSPYSYPSNPNFNPNWRQQEYTHHIQQPTESYSQHQWSQVHNPPSAHPPNFPHTRDFYPGLFMGPDIPQHRPPTNNGYMMPNQYSQPVMNPSYGGTPNQFMGAKAMPPPGPALAQQPFGEPNTPDRRPAKLSLKKTPDKLPASKEKLGSSHTEVKPVAVQRKAPANTLRILSATVQGMLHWINHKKSDSLMFELIGRVNSAISSPNSFSKSFAMKDDKDKSVMCVFYEIDRQCPKLVRGQYYRCMGTFNTQKQEFNCLSVRPATAEERKLHPTYVAASDKVMRSLVKA